MRANYRLLVLHLRHKELIIITLPKVLPLILSDIVYQWFGFTVLALQLDRSGRGRTNNIELSMNMGHPNTAYSIRSHTNDVDVEVIVL